LGWLSHRHHAERGGCSSWTVDRGAGLKPTFIVGILYTLDTGRFTVAVQLVEKFMKTLFGTILAYVFNGKVVRRVVG
jgi:hypothetical protein